MIDSIGDAMRQIELLLANHLWQSTGFALAAACVTLLLRRNAARFRFLSGSWRR